MNTNVKRNSSIEAIKIFAIISIIISHVVLSLEIKGTPYVSLDDYVVDLTKAAVNNQYLVASMLRYGGELGNTVFFLSSAWFLLDKGGTVNKRKILLMLADVWMVSVLILVIVLIQREGKVSGALIVQALFPTSFENNWYISCYIIFYIIHPFLNKIIFCMKQKTLLRINILAVFMFFFIAFLCRFTVYLFGSGTDFFSSRLVIWTVEYFIVAYLKLYAGKSLEKRKLNSALIAFGLIGNCGLVYMMNELGLKNEAFSGALQIWITPYNPFLFAFGLGLLGMARSITFENKLVNYISKLSLLIYIIHENKLLRLLYRPLMWQYVYDRYGYEHVLVYITILSAVVFIVSLIGSIVYYETIRKFTGRVCDRLYSRMASIWKRAENKMLAIH